MTSKSDGAPSLSKILKEAISLLDNGDTIISTSSENNNNKKQTPIEKAIEILTKLQTQISRAGTLSSNEVLDDVATSSLQFIGIEYHLGRALLMLPTHQIIMSDSNSNNNSNGASPSLLRKTNVTQSINYFHAYLKKVDQLDLLNEATTKEYHTLLDMDELIDMSSSSNKPTSTSRMTQSQIREMKIKRFQRKREATQKQAQLQSLLQRRTRLGLAEEEEMEGHDLESLSRTLYIETLRLYAEECLEEIQSCNSELEMLDMAIKMEQGRMMSQDPRMHSNPNPNRNGNGAASANGLSSRQSPLQMTQITQHPLTGELQMQKKQVMKGQLRPIMQRQEIANQVFRPGWNQPTMTLEELGERERADAIRRAEQQKVAEGEAKFQPRRYEQLVKDGMEDDEKLVEASAKLDRDWDDWKEENPRGSGNKKSERGDRNF